MNLKNKKLFQELNFINGQWIDGDEKYSVFNPANGEKIGEVPNLDILQIHQAVEDSYQGFCQFKKFNAKERSEILKNWHRLILENIEDLAQIMTLEQGKPLAESRSEISYGASFVEYFAEEAKRIKGENLTCAKNNQKIITAKEPIGVVGAITPWNFPSAMITRKVAPAIAAGCSVILKPSELTPFSALALGVLAKQAGMPDGVLNIITGDAQKIGEEFCSNKKVRKISFTGSTRVGKLLASYGSQDLKKLSLELGGSAPFIICADADLNLALQGLIHAKFRNGGQACTCVNRIFIDEKIHDQFLEKFQKEVKKLNVGDGFDDKNNIGPMINEAAINKVERLVNDAIKKGAECEIGGKKIKDLFFEPTILSNINEKMDIAHEEIFGAVAAIQKFKSDDEVIEKANNTSYGLGSYLFTNDMNRIWKISDALEFGMVAVNEQSFATELAPFGGIKDSGFGREGSHLGIEEFLQIKAIHMSFNS